MVRCKDCAAFTASAITRKDRGECHRRAPHIQHVGTKSATPQRYYMWPVVSENDFCLEGVEKQA